MMLLVNIIIVIASCFVPIYCQSPLSTTIVDTKFGALQGTVQTIVGKNVSSFLGVPFGKAPVGKRRLKLPEMIDGWHGTLRAQTLANTCFLTEDRNYPDFLGADMWNPDPKKSILSEDCLQLNIWVPQNTDGRVMVWIFGGGFFSGSPSLDLYNGAELAARQNVIVVNINYRLGPFGFLYFGPDSGVPGNMGLADQQLALRWIHENIESFGGNPRQVTLVGESAGGASVTSHLFAPDSHKYFQRIIVMSGSMVNMWASKDRDMMSQISMRLADDLHCLKKNGFVLNVTATVECIQGVDKKDLQDKADNISISLFPMTFPFVPVEEDEHFFKGNLFDKYDRKEFKKDIDVLIGTVKDEGTYWLPYYAAINTTNFKFNSTISAEDASNAAYTNEEQYKEAMKLFMGYFGDSPLINHAVLDFYRNLSRDANANVSRRNGVARFLGDFFFTCPVMDFADVLSSNIEGNTYMYYFTRRSSANTWPSWMGAMHGYEIEYFFGQPHKKYLQYSPAQKRTEELFADRIMKYWTDFASTGRPSRKWPLYNPISRQAVILANESEQLALTSDVHGSSCQLLGEAEMLVKNNRAPNVSYAESASDKALSLSFSFSYIPLVIVTYTFIA